MADHISRQSPSCLFQNIGQGYLIKIMDPQIWLFTAAYIQGCFRLYILSPQIHMSGHHSAVAGLQIGISDKIDQFTGNFLLIHPQPGKVKKHYDLILI